MPPTWNTTGTRASSAIRQNESSTKVFSAYVTGNTGFGLPAGEITMAGGYEWRKEGFDSQSDTIYEDGLLLGQGGPRPSVQDDSCVEQPVVNAAPFREHDEQHL